MSDKLHLARRDAIRAELMAAIPWWYSPWGHLVFPSLVGIGLCVGALELLRSPSAWDLFVVPLAFVVLNAGEWHVHRDLLHRRTWPLRVLYDRHTPEHHMVFVTEDMEIRSTREFRLVLIPFYGVVAAALTAVPIPAVCWLLGARNEGLLFFATVVMYTVVYEWLHLTYHLPSSHPIGGARIVARLRRHHARHHDPELMQKWNFNVTVPLWDWVRGSIWRPASEASRSPSVSAPPQTSRR